MVAADGTASLPPDLCAWRRLAQEVLVQAAKDAKGRGFMSCREDVLAAKAFFFSCSAVYVEERHLWFGMAGLEEPKPDDMRDMVVALCRYGCAGRGGRPAGRVAPSPHRGGGPAEPGRSRDA